ncbi:hypothetical protein [Desulfofundulus sp.]
MKLENFIPSVVLDEENPVDPSPFDRVFLTRFPESGSIGSGA